ncbi:MAG: hypothetical protein Q4C10_07230 [Clostridia bacterium]|nr:hypothetical protein [Clostridia bacterium]
MTAAEYNRKDSREDVIRIVEYVRDHVFDLDAVDITRFLRRRNRTQDEEWSKSAQFVMQYDIHNEDVRNCMAELTVEQYSTTSVKDGCPDAYVFGVHMPEIIESNPEIYLKFQINDGFFIVTIHESDWQMDYPYSLNRGEQQ